MSKCIDCFHYEICEAYSPRDSYATLHCAEECVCFTDRSEWVHLPCKVGDKVYFDTYLHGDSVGVQSHKVINVKYVITTETSKGGIGAEIPDYAFGKTVFLTREEAEKALEENK